MAAQNTKSLPQKKGMSKKKKIITIVIVAVLAVALIAGVVASVVFSNWEEYKQNAADRKTVATCNGFEIPYEELYFVTMFYKDSLELTYLVLSACRNLGIRTEGAEIDKYVDAEMKKLRDACSSEQEFEELLAENWMTEHYMRFSLGVNYLESALYYTLLDNGMFRYTLENAADFRDYVANSGDYVRTIHVFIENVEGEDPAANLAEAKKISDALRALEDPQARRELMSDYIGSSVNDDLLSVTGDGYYFTRGEMDKAYEDASFDLAMGEVSEPVVCSGGNFVIMRLYPDEEYIKENVESLLDTYHGVAVGLYEEQFKDACKVIFNEYGESIDLLSLK